MQGEVAERSEVGGVEQPAPKDPSGTSGTTPQSAALCETAADSSPYAGELIRNEARGTTPQALRASSPYAGELIRKEDMKTVELYTDGACSGNPGPGGWGAILRFNGHERELSGGEEMTTNNRMELTAVIQGLLALKESCVVELWSDSKYVIDALEKGWAWGWRRKGWIKSDKKPALNPDLWTMLLDLTCQHEMHYHWVKGHADNVYNNRCDQLAVRERENYAAQNH